MSTKAPGPVLLLDTSGLFFRAYHALPPMSTKAGEPTSALYGVSSLLLKLLREQRPAGVAWARDAPVKTFRHGAFIDYKAQRPPMPDPLRQQLGRLDELLALSRFPAFVAPGFEADDVLATLARELHQQGETVRIVTGDRDLLQLAAEGIDVLFVGRRAADAVVYDAAAVEARFGVTPAQLPTFVALVGDVSDNLPKVPRVGDRTAAALIRSHGSIEGILSALEDVEPRNVRESLRAHAEQARRTEELARLRSDVPLGDGPRFAPLTPDGVAGLRSLFEALEFVSLRDRLEKLEPVASAG